MKRTRPLWLNLCLILLGCTVASVGMGVGLSVVINQGLAQAEGSTGLEPLFQGSEVPVPNNPAQP